MYHPQNLQSSVAGRTVTSFPLCLLVKVAGRLNDSSSSVSEFSGYKSIKNIKSVCPERRCVNTTHYYIPWAMSSPWEYVLSLTV